MKLVLSFKSLTLNMAVCDFRFCVNSPPPPFFFYYIPFPCINLSEWTPWQLYEQDIHTIHSFNLVLRMNNNNIASCSIRKPSLSPSHTLFFSPLYPFPSLLSFRVLWEAKSSSYQARLWLCLCQMMSDLFQHVFFFYIL